MPRLEGSGHHRHVRTDAAHDRKARAKPITVRDHSHPRLRLHPRDHVWLLARLAPSHQILLHRPRRAAIIPPLLGGRVVDQVGGGSVESWQSTLSSTEEKVEFLLEPYIPVAGVVFLHGKPSLGKSPTVWLMGLSIAAGRPFLGLPTKGAPVLYIEVDGPPLLVRPRLRLLGDEFQDGAIPFFTLYMHPGFDILGPRPRVAIALQEAAKLQPGLVIVNTLRKVYTADANESQVPSQVYGALQRFFPHSTILLVGHDRKATQDTGLPEEENHSGSQAWRNDAQVVLHLVKHGREPGIIRLNHTKSQVSELHAPLLMKLSEDGSHLGGLHEMTIRQTLDILASLPSGLSIKEQDIEIAKALGCSERTAQRRRLELVPTMPKGRGTAVKD